MIPFTIPRDREVINLAEIVRLRQFPDSDKIEVTFSSGDKIIYNGQAAVIVTNAVMFNFNIYNEAIKAATSQIVTLENGGPSPIM